MDITLARQQLDELDNVISAAFIKRLRVVDQIARYKKEQNLPVRDEKREEAIIKRLTATDTDCQKEVESLYRQIFEITRARQDAFLQQSG